MPIHLDWQPLYQSFIDQYGEEEGESNFYAYCKKNNIDYTQPKPKKESFSWVGDVSAYPKENLIKGKAIHPIKTFHPEEWPEVREYLEEELVKVASTFVGKPLVYDHWQVIPEPYKVLDMRYEDGALEYVAYAPDWIINKVRDDKIKHASIEYNWEFLQKVNGIAPREMKGVGLGLLEHFEPGDSNTSVELWEGLIKRLREAKVKEQDGPQEFILYAIRDPTTFLEEHFSTAWIDQVNGIQGIFGRLREEPENPQPFALLFMKAKNWTVEKMQDWLNNHPQYLRSQQTEPAAVGVQPLEEKAESKETKQSLGEAVIAPTDDVTEPKTSSLVSKDEVLALLPERIPRHWGYGPYELVRRIRKKLESSI